MNRILLLFIIGLFDICMYAQNKPKAPKQLMDYRFLTLNTVVRVNQIEVARDRNEGFYVYKTSFLFWQTYSARSENKTITK